MPMTTQQPSHAERGAQIVGVLLKSWPVKEAPILIHIAFCEELQRVVAAFSAGDDQDAKWFSRLDRDLGRRLVVLRRLQANLVSETDKTRHGLEALIQKAPAELRPVLRRALR